MSLSQPQTKPWSPTGDTTGKVRSQLEYAAAFLRRNEGIRPTVTRGSAEDARRQGEELALLVDWARDHGTLIHGLPPQWVLHGEDDFGQNEHHVFVKESGAR